MSRYGLNVPKEHCNNASEYVFTDLESKRAKNAHDSEEDIYDYDGVYDSMKESRQRALGKHNNDGGKREPRYMKALMESSERRKRQRIIVEERRIQREREAEGDLYKDTEKFVTTAYRQHQEDIVKHDAQDQDRQKSHGPAEFYKNLLEREEQIHRATVEASRADKKSSRDMQIPRPSQEMENNSSHNKPIANNILVNDDGVVVDKRDLLTAGLNIVKTPQRSSNKIISKSYRPVHQKSCYKAHSRNNYHDARSQELHTVQQDSVEEKSKLKEFLVSKKSQNDVLSARERYFQRKRQLDD